MALQRMKPNMFLSCHYSKILRIVVVFVAVNMMYMLSSQQSSTNHLFCNHPVLMTTKFFSISGVLDRLHFC